MISYVDTERPVQVGVIRDVVLYVSMTSPSLLRQDLLCVVGICELLCVYFPLSASLFVLCRRDQGKMTFRLVHKASSATK
jgi:hypothetical protein